MGPGKSVGYALPQLDQVLEFAVEGFDLDDQVTEGVSQVLDLLGRNPSSRCSHTSDSTENHFSAKE